MHSEQDSSYTYRSKVRVRAQVRIQPAFVFPLLQMQQMVNSDSRYGTRPHGDALRPRVSSGMVPQGQLTPINQSQLGNQLGMNGSNGNSGAHGSPSPPESKSATPSPSSSVHEDDGDETLKVEITHTHAYMHASIHASDCTYTHTHTHSCE